MQSTVFYEKQFLFFLLLFCGDVPNQSNVLQCSHRTVLKISLCTPADDVAAKTYFVHNFCLLLCVGRTSTSLRGAEEYHTMWVWKGFSN